MIENIELALSLSDSLGKRVGESRLEYLLTEAVPEGQRGRWNRSATTRRKSPWRRRARNRVAGRNPADAPAPEAPDTAAPRSQRPQADHLTVTVHVKWASRYACAIRTSPSRAKAAATSI